MPWALASSTAFLTCGAKCIGVTRFMLFAPCAFSSSIIWARRAVVTSSPKPSCDISWFWQNTHLSGHPVKKIAPEPDSPDMGGSSQKWSALRATLSVAVAPQRPARPEDLRAWHLLGHSSQPSYMPKPIPIQSSHTKKPGCNASGHWFQMVEMKGFEPSASALRRQRSPS